MITKVDIAETLKGRPFFKGRTPQNEEEASVAFAQLGVMGEAAIFAGSYQGDTSWERHGMGDELVHVLDGSTTITILTEHGDEEHTLTAGQFVVVPQGCWHRFHTPDSVTVMTATPQPTDHSTADDPRLPTMRRG